MNKTDLFTKPCFQLKLSGPLFHFFQLWLTILNSLVFSHQRCYVASCFLWKSILGECLNHEKHFDQSYERKSKEMVIIFLLFMYYCYLIANGEYVLSSVNYVNVIQELKRGHRLSNIQTDTSGLDKRKFLKVELLLCPSWPFIWINLTFKEGGL